VVGRGQLHWDQPVTSELVVCVNQLSTRCDVGRRKRLATIIRVSTAAGTEECWGSTSFTVNLADPLSITSPELLHITVQDSEPLLHSKDVGEDGLVLWRSSIKDKERLGPESL